MNAAESSPLLAFALCVMLTASLTMSAISLLLSFLGCFVFAFVFIPIAFKWSARLLGHRLRRASEDVRGVLSVKTRNEQQQFDVERNRGLKLKKEADECEEIESPLIGSVDNGGRAGPEWQGFVGFFHPFW
jgi:acyl-CoA synthetase (AMP-forming)/AMP-acid ligase II